MLAFIRWVHTAIFVVMATAVFFILVCGLFAIRTAGIYVAIGLIAVEGVVFLGNGARCPLTNLAKCYGAEKGYVFDTWFPEHLTRFTFPVFTSLLAIGLLLAWARGVF